MNLSQVLPEAVMRWKAKPTVLLLLALYLTVRCRATMVKWCNGDMWSEPQAVFVGKSFEVFCKCNSSRVRLQDMYLKPSHLKRQVKVTPVDEYTIKLRVEVDHPRQYIRVHCMSGEDYLGEIYVNVVPTLNVTDFQCRKHPIDNEATCAFKELGLAASLTKKTYSLSVNGHPSIPCFNGAFFSSWIDCPGLYIPSDSFFGKHQQIKLSMEYEGHNQTKVFPMTLRNMTVPEWPMTQPKFSQSSSRFCLNWAYTDHLAPLAVSQNWRVEVFCRNPRIVTMYTDILVTPMFGQDLCFPNPLCANQEYIFRFHRQYNVTGARWSTQFESRELTSIATIPARPPYLYPNGFYHNPEKKELFLFWNQLDEFELNGLNFTYAAATSTGKNASSIESNCAVFSDWDPTLPATVYVWSQNSVGDSTNSTRLEVPLLTNSGSRQIRGLRYHDDNYTLTWQAPRDQQGLTDYAIFWCSVSTSQYQICDEQESIRITMVQESQLLFQFRQSMLLSNVAVAAFYKDKPSGGMSFVGPWLSSVQKEDSKTTGPSLIQVIAVIIVVVVLLSLSFVSFRKLRNMDTNKSVDSEIPDPGSPTPSFGSARSSFGNLAYDDAP